MTSSFAQQVTSLKDAFHGTFLIGTALSRDQILGKEPEILDLVKTQFNALTAENDMKWERIHPKQDQYDFETGDSLISLAEKNGMVVIGHTLVWHSQMPGWVFQNDSTGEMASRELGLKHMREHIQAVAGHYKGRVLGWDVVNEAVEDDGTLRNTLWRQIDDH